MCACEPGFTCTRCSGRPFERENRQPYHVLTGRREFDELIAERELQLANETAEPFDGHRRWTDAP